MMLLLSLAACQPASTSDQTARYLVQSDSSAYRIIYDHDDGMYAAYALSALVASATNFN